MNVAQAEEVLRQRLPQRVLNPPRILPLADWVASANIILDGRPFTFERHEYLRQPYADTHPDQVEMKATQMGLTSKAMLRVMYAARYGSYRGILYLFPAKSDVLDFSKGRITPLIADNPETIGKWVTETDAAGIKRIWNTFLYLRGMRSRVGLKSVPADLIVYDELDEAPQKMIDMAQERMAHSEFKESLKLSNPTIPDYGIDKAFQETDQRYWLLKCPSCGHYTCLEDTFPGCLMEVQGKVIRACERCQAELNPAIGEWVAKKPQITDKRGYHYSQLFSQFVAPADILKQFRTTNNLQDFHNLKIGNAYIEAENRLTIEEITHLCGNDGLKSGDPGPCSMGVDQGKDLHVVIGKRGIDKADSEIHLGVYRDWEDLDRLMDNFNVQCCVVDGLPETRNARAFSDRQKMKGRRVFLNYYNIHQKKGYAWNEVEYTVSSNRTESLDESHNQIMYRKLFLPRNCEVVKEFAAHLHNVAKKIEEDEETGSKRYVYVKLGPDHFRHAFNYECMARTQIGQEVIDDDDYYRPQARGVNPVTGY